MTTRSTRKRDERAFIKVHNGIEDHPKVAVLSDKAFRLLITTWGWCSRHTTDGQIPTAVWKQRGTPKARRELEATLVHQPGHTCTACPEVPHGFVAMHDYLAHQSSAEEVHEKQGARTRAALRANHQRHHVDKGVTSDNCEYCAEERPPQPVRKPSESDSERISESDSETAPQTSQEVEVEEEVTTHLPDTRSVSNTRENERAPEHEPVPAGPGATGPNATLAWTAVRAAIPNTIPTPVRGQLARQAAQLLDDGTPGTTLTAALLRWQQTPNAGPGLLPNIVADLVKEQANGTPYTVRSSRAGVSRPATTDLRAAETLAAGRRLAEAAGELPPPHHLRMIEGTAS